MSYPVYTVELPAHPEAVVFVQGILSRNLAGLSWLWRNVLWVKRSTKEAEGCFQIKAGICGPKEVVLVSYWKDTESLMKFFKNQPHQEMIKYVSRNPDDLCLYNETYRPAKSGKYIHEPQGLAVIYPKRSQSVHQAVQ
jgi:heme-degrading monooxygenase HmoA